MTCYLLHLDAPMSQGSDPRTGKERAATHYLGQTDDLETRLERHRNGQGSKMLRAAKQRGIGFQLARVWEGADRHFERRLHNRKDSPRMCPICRSNKENQ